MPSPILSGSRSTLSWSVEGAESISIDPGIGAVNATGTRAVQPAGTTTYTLTATNATGSVSMAATVVILPPPAILAFAATPASIGYGSSSVLAWTTSGAESLSIDHGVGTVLGTSAVVSPLVTTTYTLRAANTVAATTAGATVTVTGNTWSAGTGMASPRFYAGGAPLGGKVLVMGGVASGVLASLEIFDPFTSAWSPGPPLSAPRWGLAAAASGGRIYAVGGAPALSIVEAYDPGSNVWSARAPMPTGRSVLGLAEVNGRIFALGGSVDAAGTPTGVVEAYDPATDAWDPTLRRPMPTPRWGFGTAVVGGIIYTIGGRDASNPVHQTSVVEAYDPATDTWSTRAPMPTVRQGLVAAAVNGRIYAIGGETNGAVLGTVEQYDPSIDRWATIPFAAMPPRALSVGIAVGEHIHVVGGTTSVVGAFAPVSTVEVYATR